jgi:hypothetical protein
MSLSLPLHVLSQEGACSRRPPKTRCLCNVAVNGPSPQCRLLLLPHVRRAGPHTATGPEGTISLSSPRTEAPMRESRIRCALAPSALWGSSGIDKDRQFPQGTRMVPSGGNVNMDLPVSLDLRHSQLYPCTAGLHASRQATRRGLRLPREGPRREALVVA